MNVLIVYAHPEPSSLNGYLKETAVEVLTQNGHSVLVSDLYGMNFKAVADRNDFTELNNPQKLNYLKEQSIASKNRSFASDILAEQDKVLWADLIIFQYPIWWADSPAIIKGWFDRVFAYGFAYGPGAYDVGGKLQGKKALLSVTLGGSNLNNYGKYGRKGELNERLFNVQHEKLFFSGMDVIEPFIFPASANDDTKTILIDSFKQKLMNIENEPIIKFQSSSHYENGQLLPQYRNDELGVH